MVRRSDYFLIKTLLIFPLIDRVSNRCIVRMDHYCPWTNNAIGAGNQKMFILFIIYLDLASLYLYSLVAIVLVRASINFEVFNDV